MSMPKKSFLIMCLTFLYFSIKSCGLCELFEYKINLCELPNELQVIIAQNILQNEPEILYPLKVTEQERILLEHNKLIYSVDFINENEFIASSLDGEVLLYNLEKQTCKKIYSGKDDLHMRFVTISPDKKFIAIYSNFPGETEIKIWFLNANNLDQPHYILKGHKVRIYSVKFSQDSKYILSTAWDSTARLWDLKTGKQIKILNHQDLYKRIVLGGDISNDNKCIITMCEDTVLRIWQNEDDFSVLKRIEIPDRTIEEHGCMQNLNGYNDLKINFINDKEILFSKNDNNTKIYIFNHETNQFSYLKAIDLGKINSIYYNKKMNSVAYSMNKKTVLYCLKSDINLAIFENETEIINAQSSEKNKFLITTSKDKKIRLWNIPDFRIINIKQALFIKLISYLKTINENEMKFVKMMLNFPKKLQEACKEAFLSFNDTQKMLLRKHIN